MKEEFSEKDQKTMKGISKAIWIIAKICRICLIIGTVCVGLVMLVIPMFINKIEIKDNTIRIEGFENIVKFDDINTDKNSKIVLSKVEDIFGNNSKTTITIYTEVIMLVALATLIVNIIVFKYLEKIFKNINKEDTPFTYINANYLKKIAILMIVSICVAALGEFTLELLIHTDAKFVNVETSGILQILFIFAISYVFKYGASIQAKKAKKLKKEEASA